MSSLFGLLDRKSPNSVPDIARLSDSARSDPSQLDRTTRNGRLVLRWRIAYLVLCTVGLLLSADLMRLHVKVHTDPDYHSYCAISEWANCETVAASRYAVFFGMPIALWGLVAYLTMGALAVWGLRRPLSPASWPYGGLFWMSAFSAAASIFLFFVSHFVIGSICVICTATHLVNLILLGLAAAELIRLESGPLHALAAEVRAALQRPWPPLSLAGAVIALLLALQLGVPAYWRVELDKGPGGFPVGVTSEGYPWIGSRNPKLVITEFSDYQCPYCKRGHDEMRKLIRTYPNSVRLVHRHYPLDISCNRELQRPFHLYACAYARMAVCAEEQGRFWEANDYLFDNGRNRQPISAEDLAAATKIRADALAICVRGAEAAITVANDLEAGRELKIRGTPTFVIGDRTYPGLIPDEVINAAIGRSAPVTPSSASAPAAKPAPR